VSRGASPEVRRLEDPRAVCVEAAAEFSNACARALEERGQVRVALAGGTTPRLLHAILSHAPDRERIPWRAIDFFWGDERAVPPEHPDSNFRMAQETLLAPLEIEANRIHRMHGEGTDLDAAASSYEAEMARGFGLTGRDRPPRFDLIMLGMGSDGHTASLFPGTKALEEHERWAVANFVPPLESWRLTLTYSVINAAAHVVFLVTGNEKAAALQEVLEGAPDPMRYPSQAVAPENGRLLFLVDRDAAGR
jgi:6-phosphogluconolactonase